MAYKVHDGKRGHIFATLEEAARYADAIRKNSGYIVAVTETKAKATHVYEQARG